ITSAKPQTTRTRLLGVAISGDTQLLLVDTPGIFKPNRRLDRAMVSAAWDGAQGADVLMLLIDGKAGLGTKVTDIAARIAHHPARKIAVFNKVDIAAKDKLLVHAERLNDHTAFEELFFISAATGDGVAELTDWLVAQMPEAPWHFPEDQVSDLSERLMSSEIVREKIMPSPLSQESVTGLPGDNTAPSGACHTVFESGTLSAVPCAGTRPCSAK
ncbi:MAG: hypothetical protein HC855_12510, partial [Rhizobiales bacterium]|nr:hypothetical protein [Hyphomicrobiales bacterium]